MLKRESTDKRNYKLKNKGKNKNTHTHTRRSRTKDVVNHVKEKKKKQIH